MRFARRLALAAVVGALGLVTSLGPARADDTADEADLQFQLGAAAYQAQNYRAALEHFHASNRLAPNRNVVFNIARTYENLGDFPAAFRYYDQALDGESSPEARANVEAAIQRIAVQVAILQVRTTPAGATVFIDRRDLGPRGVTPRRLGLAPGTYRVLVDLPGYEPATASVTVDRGASSDLQLELRQILGSVAVAGTAEALVRADDPQAPVRCRVPCTLELSPGRHHLYLSRDGYREEELSVDVVARQITTVRRQLALRTGTVVVSTDEPGALVEVNGESRGFTPTVVTLPVGDHTLRVSSPGFEPVERTVVVTESAERRVDLSLAPAEEIEAASRVTERADSAPSSVSIIPRAELRAFAYPTIAEALRGTRGVYLTDDRAYVTLGIRGLARQSGYGNRVLVLHDGTPTNDDWVGASFVGYDAMVDLGDVERLELVRGPGSALYGTGAFSGVVNVVTRNVKTSGAEAAVGTELDGVARARARGNLRLGEKGSLWTSVSAARSEGRDFYFPEYGDVTPPYAPPGYAVGVDGFKAATTRGRATYRWLSLAWYLNTHQKTLPAHYDTSFGDDGNWNRDSRGYLELRADPKLGERVALASRVYLHHYGFRGEYVRDLDAGGLQVDRYRSQWVGMEQRLILTPIDTLRLTLGGEIQHHYLVEQRGWDAEGTYLDQTGDASNPFQIGAAYAVVDADVTPSVRVSGGARLDSYSSWGSTVNPRAAVILRPYEAGNTKLLFGRAFRAPSVYELHYNDAGATQIEPPTPLLPETVYSGEIEHAHRFSPTVTLTGAANASYVTDLLDTEGGGTVDDPLYFVNSSSPLATAGAELSLRRDWRRGFMGLISYTLTTARFLASTSSEDVLGLTAASDLRHVANVPLHAATLKGAAPLLGRRLTVASRLTVESGRWDRFERVGDSPQGLTDPYALWDVILTGHETSYGLEYALGVYNLFDWRYRLPVSDDLVLRSMPQSGRTLLASLGVSL